MGFKRADVGAVAQVVGDGGQINGATEQPAALVCGCAGTVAHIEGRAAAEQGVGWRRAAVIAERRESGKGVVSVACAVKEKAAVVICQIKAPRHNRRRDAAAGCSDCQIVRGVVGDDAVAQRRHGDIARAALCERENAAAIPAVIVGNGAVDYFQPAVAVVTEIEDAAPTISRAIAADGAARKAQSVSAIALIVNPAAVHGCRVEAEGTAGKNSVGECQTNPAADARLVADDVYACQRQVAEAENAAAEAAISCGGSTPVGDGHAADGAAARDAARDVKDAKVRRPIVAPHGEQVCARAVKRHAARNVGQGGQQIDGLRRVERGNGENDVVQPGVVVAADDGIAQTARAHIVSVGDDDGTHLHRADVRTRAEHAGHSALVYRQARSVARIKRGTGTEQGVGRRRAAVERERAEARRGGSDVGGGEGKTAVEVVAQIKAERLERRRAAIYCCGCQIGWRVVGDDGVAEGRCGDAARAGSNCKNAARVWRGIARNRAVRDFQAAAAAVAVAVADAATVAIGTDIAADGAVHQAQSASVAAAKANPAAVAGRNVIAEGAIGEHPVGAYQRDPAAGCRRVAGNVNIGQRQIACAINAAAETIAARSAHIAPVADGHAAEGDVRNAGQNVKDSKVGRGVAAPHSEEMRAGALDGQVLIDVGQDGCQVDGLRRVEDRRREVD